MSDDTGIRESACEEETLGRRNFFTKLIGAGALLWTAAAAYPIFSFLKAPESDEQTIKEVNLGNPAQFKPGTGTRFAFGKKPGYILVDDKGGIIAVSAICTHLGCVVQFYPEYKQFRCACHGGRYDFTGKNISGPPPAPLEKYRTEIRKGELWVTKA